MVSITTPAPDKPKENLEDPAFVRGMEIRLHGQDKVDAFVRESREVNDLHAACYATDDDPNEMANPMLMAQVIDRILEQIRPLDYILRIPNSTQEERQVIRDLLSQIQDESGFISCLRDDPRGFLSQVLTGNTLIHFGASDDPNTPIKFRCLSMSQAFFPKSATQLRSKNGENDVNECFIVFEFPYDEVIQLFPQAEGKATWGDLPSVGSREETSNREDQEDRQRERITQIGVYYNKIKKIHKAFIGPTAFRAVDNSGSKYKWVLEGKPYIPLLWLRTKRIVGELYGKGIGHQHAKLAREDQRRRNMALRHIENNVFPIRGVRMAEDKFGIFLGQMFEAAEARRDGEDPLVRFEPDDPGKIETLVSDPLTQEWERANQDTTEQVKRNGIAIQDVDRPATQTATQTISEERAKTRQTVQIQENNASEYKFAYQVMIDFSRRFIRRTNDTPIATNVKVTLGAEDGIPSEIGEIQAEVGEITYGQAADFLKENKKIIVQEDSRSGAWETDAFLMAKTTQALQFGAGTPAEAGLRQTALGNLGIEVLSQNLKPLPNESPNPPRVGQTPGLPQAKALSQGLLP